MANKEVEAVPTKEVVEKQTDLKKVYDSALATKTLLTAQEVVIKKLIALVDVHVEKLVELETRIKELES